MKAFEAREVVRGLLFNLAFLLIVKLILSRTSNTSLEETELRYGSFMRNKSGPVPTVCGTLESIEYLAEGKSCYGRSNETEKYDLTPCPWPKSSILETLDIPKKISLNPIPGNNGFRNFSLNEMKELLKNKTIILVGDSTARRLFVTLCNLLAHDPDLTLIENGDSYEGWEKYIDRTCTRGNLKSKLGINLVYTGAIQFKYYKSFFDEKATTFFGPGATVHAFVPFLSFHLGLRHGQECVDDYVSDDKNSSQIEEDYKSCGMSSYLGEEITQKVLEDNTPRGVSCGLVAKFYNQCSKTRNEILKKDPETEIFFHGISNTPIASTVTHPLFEVHNEFFSYEPMLSAYSLELGEERCSAFQEFVKSDSHCDFVDMTSWMTNGKHWTEDIEVFQPELDPKTRRSHECIVGEGDRAIHVLNEQGQLMRIQTIINAISHREQARSVI